MRVGFGVTALCNGLAGGGLDGIGNYAREMMLRMGSVGGTQQPIELVPFSFGCAIPKDLGTKVSAVQHASSGTTSPHLSDSVELGRYSANTAWSVVTGVNFFGINALTKQVDLIHATDHYLPKCKPAPLVATLMDAIPLSHPHWLRSEFRSIKNMLWTRAANWADEIITISEYSKIELSKWARIPLNKITVIPLGVDERWFREVSELDIERVRAQYQLLENFFISVGTLQPRKNVESTIRAHRLLSHAERLRTPLIIVGRAGWKCDEVLRLIDEDTTTGAVRWLQHVPDADLLPILKLATALVFPSLGEGFGLPVLEAFAASVPVITSNTTSLPEVAGDAALAVNPLDVDQIKEAMSQMLEDNALVKNLKSQGLVRAHAFTWESCALSTLQVYQRIIQNH
jgi:glycosyltransferase involved in cell wall biosynthesis